MKNFKNFLAENKDPKRTEFETEVNKHRDALSKVTDKKLNTTFKHATGESRAIILLPNVDHKKVKNYLEKHFGVAEHDQGNQIYDGSDKMDVISHRTPLHPDRGTIQRNPGIHIFKYHE